MEAKNLFEWRDVLVEYVGFLASFWVLGAVGFRFAVLRGSVDGESRDAAAPAGPLSDSAARAAVVGLAGVVCGAVSMLAGLLKRAESKHQALADTFSAGGATSIAQVVLLAVLVVAFALAWRRVALAWPLAGVAAIALALRNVLAGRLAGMVNPLHVLGASLWLGTLFVLVTCGIARMLALGTSERERLVAEMVQRFSMLALASAGLLGITGVVTALTHLEPLSALWTTPYGYALIVKLCIVAVVALLGAWNWRRVGPSLGREGGARQIRRTASTELVFAALVLFVTAILVSLPSPKAQKHPGPAATSATASLTRVSTRGL